MIDWSIRYRFIGDQINYMLDLEVCRYPCRHDEDVSVFFHDPVHLILLQREALCRGHRCGSDLLLTVSMDHKEDELLSL
jgi:hypothetical protein